MVWMRTQQLCFSNLLIVSQNTDMNTWAILTGSVHVNRGIIDLLALNRILLVELIFLVAFPSGVTSTNQNSNPIILLQRQIPAANRPGPKLHAALKSIEGEEVQPRTLAQGQQVPRTGLEHAAIVADDSVCTLQGSHQAHLQVPELDVWCPNFRAPPLLMVYNLV